MSMQKRTKIFIGIAVIGAAILGGLSVATGFFPPHENASGAIGAVKKMNDQQIDKKDVVLGSAAGANDAAFQTGQAGLGSRALEAKALESRAVDSKSASLNAKALEAKALEAKALESRAVDSKASSLDSKAPN